MNLRKTLITGAIIGIFFHLTSADSTPLKKVISPISFNSPSIESLNSNFGIIDLRENDNGGTPVYLDSVKTVSGIVTASNEFGTSGAGYLQDNQAGIGVYGSGFISQLTNGDSVTITAKVAFFRGLTQFTFVSGESELTVHKNTSVPDPETVTIQEILNQDWDGVELLEGKLLRIDNVSFVQSGTFAGNITYQITDGSNNLNVRIDGDTDIPGNPIPTTEFSIVGCLSQYDSSEPYSSGYQLMPRNDEDFIVISVVADFSADNTFGNLPLTVNFTDLSLNNPTTWSWNFGDGNTSTIQNPQHIYTALGDYTVSLTVGDGSGTNTKTRTNYITVTDGELTTSSDNFIFHYTKSEICTQSLIDSLEKKFNNLDYILHEIPRNIYLLDRSQKIKVFLYDTDETFLSPPADLRDWDAGYYLRDQNEIHIKVPATKRQLKYFPTFEKAAISVLARYIMAKKRIDGSEPSKGLSFGFGLYESGYSLDLDIIRNYLGENNNTFPNSSTFSTWAQLDDETNVEIAYSFVFATIFRRGYFQAIVNNGLYEYDYNIWYQVIRIFFLLEIEDGGMRKFVEEDDFIIYANSQEEANLVLDGLRWYRDICEETLGARINHPLLVTIYGSAETYTYTRNGNINVIVSGGEALSHNLLRSTSGAANLDTELNRIKVKHNDTMEHEFTHMVEGFIAETTLPSWLNEGAAMNLPEQRVYGYIGFNVQYFAQHHNYWNDRNMLFPGLNDAFTDGAQDPGFGYHMSYSAFTFLKDQVSKEALIEFIKRSDDFSIIGYSGVDEFQRHLYETLYHNYMPSFLFNANWDSGTTFTSGTNYLFGWDGHYIEDLILEYSVDGTKSWNQIAEVALSSGSYSWNIPDAENCILRFSDKKFPEIDFSFQILGDKPAADKILYMPFENAAANGIPSGNNGRLKGNVSFESRGGEDGNYAKFDGRWDVINVPVYESLSLDEEWTIQGDFLIENTTGLTNQKPVLLEKMATLEANKNYAISFNKNGQNHLLFEYQLENSTTVSLEVEDAGITNGNWYTFYFARSVENNIAEARVYDNLGNMLGNDVRQINGEGTLLTGAGDLYLSSGDFRTYEQDLQGGLDNIIISDTYHDELMSNSINNTPVLANIPDQTINEGGSFTAIQLDDFVTDPDNEDSQISWSFSGNNELIVAIDTNRVATVNVPDENWFGSETITFIATDPGNTSDCSDIKFTVYPVNDSPIINYAPELVEFVSDTSVTIDIWVLVSDVESSAKLLVYEFYVDSDSILFAYDDAAGNLTLSAELKYGGESDLVWSVIDSELTVKDTIHIVVKKAVNNGLDEEQAIPKEFTLYQNYPNPFNPTTTIRYDIPNASNVTLTIFNMNGQIVERLVNQKQEPGFYSVNWNAQNVSTGVYFYQIRADGFQQVKKMLLIK